MLKYNFKSNRGDTLVEVMFAVAIFSLVAVSSLSIMNQGTATAERALEITLVRQEIDSQAETLRFLNSSYIAAFPNGVDSISASSPAGQWVEIKKHTVGTEPLFVSGAVCPPRPDASFILDMHTATFKLADTIKPAVTFSQVVYNPSFQEAQGIWITAVKPGSDNYIDFHIEACWDSPGQSVPVTLGTIVRLYEP